MLVEALRGLGLLACYFLGAALTVLLIYRRVRMPAEVFRKLLHVVAVLSAFVVMRACAHWQAALLCVLAFMGIVYAALAFVERMPWFLRAMPQRKRGEFKRSLVVLFGMMALLIAVFWGLLGESWKYVIIVAIMAWGFGDAAAALVGKARGRHPIEHRLLDGKKTYEGSASMCAVSALMIFVWMLAFSGQGWGVCLLCALLISPVCAVVELFSGGGMDTITVPLSAACALFALLSAVTRLGL